MAHLIRRHSMERLELYDLDKLLKVSSSPPIPPPRKYQHRRSSVNPIVERYQFLCNTTRNKTDPIYAATPMFTTIPQSIEEKSYRQLLGSYVCLENVKPIPLISTKTAEIIENKEENSDDDILKNDNKGIIEQIFNRDENKE